MIERKSIFGPFKLVRELPQNFTEEDRLYFKNELQRDCSGVNLVTSHGGLLDTHKGVVIDGWKVVPESLVTPELLPSYGLGYVCRTLLKKSAKLDGGRYLLIHTSYCEGYGHWMSDAIPRLFAARKYLADYKLLLPDNYTAQFYSDSLMPFGLGESQIQRLDRNLIYRIDSLVFPSHIGPSFCNVKEDVLRSIRELYFEFFAIDASSPKRRIYISRQKVARRFVKNEEEVIELLSKNGFDVIHFQDLSFTEQLKVSAESEIMVGLTGSGLNNMMFMKPGSKVLEFKMKNDLHNLHYFGFSSGLQLPYFYLICDTVGDIRFEADFIVDIPRLANILKKMLSDEG